MISDKEAAVLRVLKHISIDGKYKIVDSDDILNKMPVTVSLDKKELLQIMIGLSNRELISLKMSTLEEYVFAFLSRADIALQDISQDEAGESKKEKKAKQEILDMPVKLPVEKPKKVKEQKAQMPKSFYLKVFLLSFAGAMLGGLIATIIVLTTMK